MVKLLSTALFSYNFKQRAIIFSIPWAKLFVLYYLMIFAFSFKNHAILLFIIMCNPFSFLLSRAILLLILFLFILLEN